MKYFFSQISRSLTSLIIRGACIGLCASTLHAAELKPFTTDGCSAFPDGSAEDNAKWIQCCIKHDFAYWKGGTYEDREVADFELKQCVGQLGEKTISNVMLMGVRFGGSPFFPTWYRWGYGWPYMRGYQPLSEQETQQVTRQLLVLRNLIDGFIAQSNPQPE